MYGTDKKLVGFTGQASNASRRFVAVIGSVDGNMYKVDFDIIARRRSLMPP